jgi:hypothetical protein
MNDFPTFDTEELVRPKGALASFACPCMRYTFLCRPREAQTSVASQDTCKANAPLEDSEPSQPPRPLFNGRDPLYTLKSERPEHRVVIMLSATGMGNKEMSEHLAVMGYRQYTPQAIAYIKKQPWAVKQILEEIERAGREPVKMLLQSATYEATETLVTLMQGADSEMVKKQAAESILDRAGFGKNINITTKADPAELSDAELLSIAGNRKSN